MEYLVVALDIVLHLDAYLAQVVANYGSWIYAVLFAVIFAETGFVVLPFLPGDSLLFVAGALAAVGGMDISVLLVTLSVAAVLGNTTNYALGRYFGPRVFQWPDSRFFSQTALRKTQAFYQRHGGKTIVLSRFLPLFRTFAPFVAGIGAMGWPRFMLFNAAGGVGWVVSLTLAGYWFGNVPIIRNNLTVVVVGVVVVSLLPALVGWWRHRHAAA